MTREQMINFGRKDGRGQPKKGKPTIIKLMLSLEEIYNGCVKKMKVKYTVSTVRSSSSSLSN